jgi:hypothetical protein
MCFLEGLLPESGFIGHHYSVLKERLRAPLVGACPRFLLRARRRSVTSPRHGPALQIWCRPSGAGAAVRTSSLRTA